VSHLVVVEVAGGCEPLAADSTLVRLLSTVDTPVSVQAVVNAIKPFLFVTDAVTKQARVFVLLGNYNVCKQRSFDNLSQILG
jgi:hypothetical protein